MIPRFSFCIDARAVPCAVTVCVFESSFRCYSPQSSHSSQSTRAVHHRQVDVCDARHMSLRQVFLHVRNDVFFVDDIVVQDFGGLQGAQLRGDGDAGKFVEAFHDAEFVFVRCFAEGF